MSDRTEWLKKWKGEDFVAYSDGALDDKDIEEPLNKVTGWTNKNFYGKNYSLKYHASFLQAKSKSEKQLMHEGNFLKNDIPHKILGLKFLNEEKLTALI